MEKADLQIKYIWSTKENVESNVIARSFMFGLEKISLVMVQFKTALFTTDLFVKDITKHFPRNLKCLVVQMIFLNFYTIRNVIHASKQFQGFGVKKVLTLYIQSEMSLMKMLNRRGLRFAPWGFLKKHEKWTKKNHSMKLIELYQINMKKAIK